MTPIESTNYQLHDMDFVLLRNGDIFRILGNLHSGSGLVEWLGYKAYAPAEHGRRIFRGKPYDKCDSIPRSPDILDSYHLLDHDAISEFFDPIATAADRVGTCNGTIWAELYERLIGVVGPESVGVFGSALVDGLHLDQAGHVRNDVDFFIDGIGNLSEVRSALPDIMQDIGFDGYDEQSARQIIDGWSRIYVSPHNSFELMLRRRWSGMQYKTHSQVTLNTIRFRDCRIPTPIELIEKECTLMPNVHVAGTVVEADHANLYPRSFLVETKREIWPVYCFWWQLCSPVVLGDPVRLCGDVVRVGDRRIVRISNRVEHWISLQR